MAREIEAKFRLEDVARLRQRLAALGAQRADTVQEQNLLLDTPARQLLRSGCGLRIRVAQPLDESGPRRVTLTYKGPRDPHLHHQGIKAREEIELDAGDDARLVALFARLGFAPVLCYEKRRETWRLGGTEVVLDELPQLGWFAEIEAPDSEAVESLRAQLGLDPTAAVPETYPELTARFGTPDADGTRGLRFGTGTTESADRRRR
jgi:predicted adenylyl cyclase CyaB